MEASAYCKLDNLTLNNTMHAALQAGVGDLVGQAAKEAVLDVGSITYTNSGQASALVSQTGAGTVLHLAGAITDNSTSSGHIVRTQTNSLLYADTGYPHQLSPGGESDGAGRKRKGRWKLYGGELLRVPAVRH